MLKQIVLRNALTHQMDSQFGIITGNEGCAMEL